MDDDYLSYFEDFEQESGSRPSSSYHSFENETKFIIRQPKEVKKVKKTKKPAMATVSSPRDRLLSSKDHELRAMQNKLTASRKQFQDIERENKTLRRLQIRQEKELTKLSSKEGELPMILERHNREVKSLREQLKKTQKKNKELTKKQSDLSDELWRANERKKDLEALTKKKDLKEREHLMMELQDTVEVSKKKSQRILELEKAGELMNKTHTQEVKSLLSKQKLLSSKLANTEQEMIRFRQQLKEKERLLEVTNIYSQRAPPSSLLPPPLPSMVDTSIQTTLTQPMKYRNKEMVLTVKRKMNTAESQTDGDNWNMIKKFSSKQNMSKSVSSEDGKPIEASKPSPPSQVKQQLQQPPLPSTVPVTAGTASPQQLQPSSKGDVPVEPSAVAQATPPSPPRPQRKLPTRPPIRRPRPTSPIDDKPLMDLQSTPKSTPSATPIVPPSVPPPANSSATPTVSPLAKTTTTPTQQSPDKSNIHQILFGTSTGATPTQAQQAPPTQNDITKAQMDKKQKDELMRKLFPQKYATEAPKEEPKEDVNEVQDDEGSGRRRRRSVDLGSTSKRATELFGTSSIADDDKREPARKQRGVNGLIQQNTRIGSAVGGRKVNANNNNSGNQLSQLFNTNSSPVRDTGNGTKKKDEDKIIDDSSSTSLLSQSERIKNMHKGLPSMASGDDLYGTKGRRSNSGNNQGAGTVKHGRRAVQSNVKSSTSGTVMMFGEPSVPTNTLFGNGPVNGTTSPDESTAGASGYPWEMKVNTGNHRVNNSNSRLFDEEIDEIAIN